MKKIKNVANMRDLGGIPVSDGKRVVPGRLIRGGHLSKVRDKDIHRIATDLGIARVIDLRSQSEHDERPDKLPDSVEYTYLPSLTNEQNPAITRKNRSKELKKIMSYEGGAVGHLSRLYRVLITQEMAILSHRGLLLSLLDTKEGAVYWHCTQGKDRTGVASAVILMALGASKEEILKDYLNEATSLKVKNAFLTTLVGIVMFNMRAKTNLSALMNAKYLCMEAALDEVEKKYGTMINYIKSGLGMTDEQIFELRKMYLE